MKRSHADFTRLAPFLAVLLIAVLIVAACSSAPAPSPTAKPAPAPTATPSPSPTAKPTAAPAAVKLRYHFVPTSSGQYRIGVAVRQAVIAEYPELEVTIISTGSVLERLELFRQKGSDVGWLTGEVTYCAYFGTEEYKGKPITNIRTLYFPTVATITNFATKDSGVTSVSQLTGKPFGSFAGTATERLHRWMFEALGIQPKWDAAGDAAMVDAVKARRTIGYAKSGNPDPGILDVASLMPITILGFTQQDIDKANAAHPGQFLLAPIAAKTYPGQDKEIFTFGYTQGDGIDKDVPEEIAYKWIAAVYKHQKVISTSAGGNSAGFADVIGNTLKYATVPLHTGVIKFFKEKGFTVPDKLIPPEAKK